MSAENQTPPDVQTLTTQLAQAAKEAQEARKEAQEATKQAKQTQESMEAIRKAAMGETNEPKPKPRNEQFLDDVVVHGDEPIRQVIRQELQQKAYVETMENNFKKKNPHLAPLQQEVFGMANQIIQQGVANGQRVGNEEALKQASEHYNDKLKQYSQLAGANAMPGGQQGYPTPNSRYEGSEKNYFAMTDDEWKKSPERRAKQEERKQRQRNNVSYYGSGR